MARATSTLLGATAIVFAVAFLAAPAMAQDKKPNIVIIWGDDIGQTIVSA